ncbi:hypothetical protein EGR_07950 [Echinococcus granulosus]|uniref:Uncharacterized protein n=1 Tax=Echinococcus granulosus TaxID=6210 RepID=W6U9K8_ECHGR|nr:hypothetical protein EGR_07950 [Echinococcus granulosus]EUB57201.1 hypothetical protein EGR_07950 [Echinococcus granulosus]
MFVQASMHLVGKVGEGIYRVGDLIVEASRLGDVMLADRFTEQMESCSAAVAAGDLSIFDTSHLVDDSGAVEVDDDDVDVDEGGVDVDCVEVVDDVNDDVEVSPAHIRGSLSNASATSSTIATPTNSNHQLRHHALSPGLQHRLSRSPFVPESAGQALR